MSLYIVLSLLSVICLILQFEPMTSWSEWHLDYIRHGEWWRIVTGNLTHTNLAHFALNIAALWIIAFFFRPTSRNFTIAFITLCAIVGFFNLFTTLSIYVGLSGVLHGLFGYWALKEVFAGRKSSIFLVGVLIAKVAWEQCFGPSVSTTELISADVAIEAHLSGAMGGLGMALLEKVTRRHIFG